MHTPLLSIPHVARLTTPTSTLTSASLGAHSSPRKAHCSLGELLDEALSLLSSQGTVSITFFDAH